MNGNGRKPLRCPCCTAGGVGTHNPVDLVPDGVLRQGSVKRAGGWSVRWLARIHCTRCGWQWWSANPAALELTMKMERTRRPRMPNAGRAVRAGV